ncbi:MAG: hypothetical protein WA188_03910 [Terriglobales bacterium]
MPRAALKLFLIAAMTAAVPALALEHATEGVITHVDSAAKKIAVKTADGTEEVFKFTGKTAMHAAKGVKTGAVDTYLAGKEGTHVVVHYTEEGAEKTAVAVDDFGKDTVKVGKGTVTDVDKAGHTVTIKTEDGSEETYHVAKDAAVDTEHGVVKGTEYTAKKGEKVTVHYTEEGGRKVAHFIKHL